jgi:RimJ/RimL family protein N-acetyltransferase
VLASSRQPEQTQAMDPVTLTSERLLLRPVGPHDTDAVHDACQDPEIQRWIPIPSPYLREHAASFTEQMVPDGWADSSMFTFGMFLPATGELVGTVGLTMRSLGAAEIGFWATKQHRGNGYITEAVGVTSRWGFTDLAIDRVEWRAEVGNTGSRTVAERAGFTIEGVLRSGTNNKGVRRDIWVGSLLPSDLGLPSTAQYVPAPERD